MTMSRRMFLEELGAGAAGLGLASTLTGCASLGPAAAAGALPRSTPEAEGMASAAVLAFLAAAAHNTLELHSLMILRHGRVVADGWWAPYGPEFVHGLYSLSKSFTSTAVGLAVAEGRLSVNDRVAKFFPDALPATVSDNLAALRVKDLLSMSAGDEKEPTHDMVNQEDWVRYFLAAPITHPPGSVFMYNSAATYMCSAIVQKVTGQKVIDYLQPRLFAPLGIEGARWETCPRGINTGGWGLSVRTEDLARFGQLYLQKGAWRGRQILPAAWVEEATTFKIQQPLPAAPGRPNDRNDWVQGYCYQFWRCTHHAFRGDGAFGQFCVVMPDQDAVVVMTAESRDLQGQLDLVWEHLLPAMQPGPLPADAAGQKQVQQALFSLALALPEGQPASPAAARVSGKTFRLEPNGLGLQSVAFAFGNAAVTVAFRGAQADYAIPCGVGRWQRGATALPGTPPRLVSGGAPKPGTPSKIASAAAWKDENTLDLLLRYYETPHHDAVTCRFAGASVQIAFMNSMAAMGPNPQDKRGVLRGSAQ